MLDLDIWVIEPLPFALRKHFFLERMRGQGLRITLTEIQGYVIDSCLSRFDEEQAEELLRDWQVPQARPKEWIYRWQPGTHYHVLDEKFNTEREARDFLDSKGYECLGVDVRYVYTTRGD